MLQGNSREACSASGWALDSFVAFHGNGRSRASFAQAIFHMPEKGFREHTLEARPVSSVYFDGLGRIA